MPSRGLRFHGIDGYRPGNAYFTCDVCSQTWRRAKMRVRWDYLRVCPPCNDPRPPQMSPPNIYPEGIPFPDARPPQDAPSELQDGSYLQPQAGGFTVTTGVEATLRGQTIPPGLASPQDFLPSPVPTDPANQDAITLNTGPIDAPLSTSYEDEEYEP